MKIKEIGYQNFRNFQAEDHINLDDKITIIYGENGAGKTTMHQLFRWIIYGDVQFNKSSDNNKLYNTELESRLRIGDSFVVWGTLDFEHNNYDYQIHRKWTYTKSINGVILNKRQFSINRKNKNNDWERVSEPAEFIEEILPSGLSPYFFFDGERMIEDLRKKGKDSAKELKDAIYLLLDLSVYDKASEWIGEQNLKTTVLGKLLSNKAEISGDDETSEALENAQNSKEDLLQQKNEFEEKIKNAQNEINEISEKIGSNSRSQKEYENKRKQLGTTRDVALDSCKMIYRNFGEEIAKTFPKLLLSSAVDRASDLIKKFGKKSKLPHGITKELVDSLVKEKRCICGNKITKDEISELKKLYDLLPPRGYDNLYNNFIVEAKAWGKEYDPNKLDGYLSDARNTYMAAFNAEQEIHKIDEEMKANKPFEDLIVKREKCENEIKENNESRDLCIGELKKADMIINKCVEKLNKTESIAKENQLIDEKISIMLEVKKYFNKLLDEKSKSYSAKMQKSIQDLINKMLKAKRKVEMTKDFTFKVVDSYDDEAKSEGQFATISFAYIGGIFNVLREENILNKKGFPLVLDAPFSKLGDEPRQKVIQYLPEYAPQIILFSKDNLSKDFGKKVGLSYTIVSKNDEQNVAVVEEGCKIC